MDTPVKVQQHKPHSVGRVVKMASLDYSPVKKLDRKRPRKSKRSRRNEPKDILKSKWRANVDMKLLSHFASMEYRDHDYFEDAPSDSAVFEAVRLMQNDRRENCRHQRRIVAKDERMDAAGCRRISIIEPLRNKYKPSKGLAVSDDEPFLINFQRDTHAFQRSLVRFKEFSAANINAKRERDDDDFNQEVFPNSKKKKTTTTFVVS